MVIWVELKGYENKVRELVEWDKELARSTERMNVQVMKECELYKECFVEVNKNKQMIEDVKG